MSKTWSGLALLLTAACAAEAGDHAAQVRQADIEFAAQTAERGVDGWTAFFLPDGVMFPPNGRVEGQEAIRAHMTNAFQPGTRLDWEPVTAVAAESGDLAYTIGRWTSVVVRADGSDSVTGRGNYVTIWRRDADGRWRVAVDIGNPDAAEATP